ncbi:replication initiation protein [Psychrobacter sp. Ps1]|uniref:RepB family plasmid replication initiator protein n=1 Tax=Psychrobacter sp. Ps1 TaxID=2790955 RepID=UPI001EE054C9|nr:RepB family plasmid replication initiator protein [Psychrobacter sp. Ps1]MCG3843647.1 replication initiation protein [Psychrobacter sp. Ps1]
MSSLIDSYEKKYPENWVVMQNRIEQCFHKMTLDEKRLLILASPTVRMIDASEKDAIEITAEQFANECGIKVSSAYKQLEVASKNLLNRSFSYINERGKRVGVTWVIRAVYEDGYISVCFPDEVLIMLKAFDASNPFTKYKKENVLLLKGEYSIDLYHIAKKYEGMSTFQMTLEDYKLELGLPKSYNRINNLKARALEPAIDEINEKTDINITYENIKRGRTVTGLKFTVKPKAKPKKALEEKRDPHTADMFTVEGLNDKQLGRIVRNPAFIAEYNHLVTPTSPAGQTAQGWEFEMINRLKKDTSDFKKRPIRDYLEY